MAQHISGFKPAYTPKTPNHVEPHKDHPKRRVVVTVFVLVLLGGLAFGGYTFWQHRPVSISVAGQKRTVLRLTTLAELFESDGPDVSPGNFVSVGGDVLEEGKGYRFSATVNDAPVPNDEVETYQILGNEEIEFGNGANRLEEHTTEVVEVQPKFEFVVAEGLGDKAFQTQQGLVQYVKSWGKVGTREILHGSETGETADGDWVEEGSNLVVVAQNITPDDGKKLVALTFDDGPTYFTREYLSILENKGVAATFSVVGRQLEDSSAVVQEAASKGHQIINGTWDHVLLTELSKEDLQYQVRNTSTSLKDLLDADTMYVRPPFGDMDADTWLASEGSFAVSVHWTQDARDWEQPGSDEIVANACANMAPGSIILMHDGGGDRTQDLDALPQIISKWQKAGYTFVTLKELLESDSSIDMTAINAGPMPADATWPLDVA